MIQLESDTQFRYTPDIGVVPEGENVRCGVCRDIMNEHRDCLGPRGFVQAMSGGKSPHDVFECPNCDEMWHKQVVALRDEMKKTPSVVVASLMEKELKLILETRQETKEI